MAIIITPGDRIDYDAAQTSARYSSPAIAVQEIMEIMDERTRNFEINIITNPRGKEYASCYLTDFSDFEEEQVPGVTPAGRTLKQHNLILGFNKKGRK